MTLYYAARPRSRVSSRRLGIAALLLVVLVAAGCGSGDSDDNAQSGSSGDASTQKAGVAEAKAMVEKYSEVPTMSVTTPLKEPAPADMSVAWLTNSEVPQNAAIGREMEKAADALGWSYDNVTYQTSNPATLQAAFRTALAKRPDMVSLAGDLQANWGGSTASDYAKEDATIVATATTPFTPAANVLGVPHGEDAFYEHGQMLAAWLIADSNGSAKAVMEHIPAFGVLTFVRKGFDDTIDKFCPDCSIKHVNMTIPQVTAGEVVPALVSSLRSNPGYDYLLFDYGDVAGGVESALSGAGLGDVKIAGAFASPPQLAALEAGTHDAWTAFNPSFQAYQAIDMWLRDMQGMEPEPGDVVGPLQLLTQDNVKDVSGYSEPEGALQSFEELWGR